LLGEWIFSKEGPLSEHVEEIRLMSFSLFLFGLISFGVGAVTYLLLVQHKKKKEFLEKTGKMKENRDRN